QAARLANRLLLQRQGAARPGIYEGVFESVELLDKLADDYGPDYGWSPSQLNRYGACPYGFFARVILQLDPLPEPQEGVDVRQRGNLLHALLEELHSCLHSEGLALTAEHREAVLERLDDCCAALFDAAPRRYGFRAGPLWEYEKEELHRLLRALVAWECETENGGAQFQPAYQEVRFGLHGTLTRLPLEDAFGIPFDLHGVIDRIDQDAEGYIRIIDYKSGSQTYSENDIRRGLAFQSALYALAAERLLPDISGVVDSYYLHLPTRKRSGHLRFASQVYDNDVVREAVAQAALFVASVRAGYFPSAPGKPGQGHLCRSGCEYAGLCRVTRRSVAKAGQFENQGDDGD
ncbi:MAG: PD-(D/E)XK nuclease family protein, partial [Ardenticatenales bacterium]|nr:PD-(D/E)XK nuclease family protein [Ardenticatenales bacterium]